MPCWKTSTMSPKVALTESEFMITALSGTSSERNASARITEVAARTSIIRRGNWRSRSCWKSRLAATYPPTSTRASRNCLIGCDAASARAFRTTSIAVVSEVVSRRITSTRATRASRLR